MKNVFLQLAVASAVLSFGAATPEVQAANQAAKAHKAAPAAKSAPPKKSASAVQPGRKPNTTQARPARAGAKTQSQAKSRSGGKAAPRAYAAAGPRAQPPSMIGDSRAGAVALASPSNESGSPAPATRRPKPIANRAYAIDGETFFHNGRKIRIQGIDRPDQGQANNEVAKQRLQSLLDSGEVSIHPVTTDEAGSTLAVVRVNGRDVADRLRGEVVEQAQ